MEKENKLEEKEPVNEEKNDEVDKIAKTSSDGTTSKKEESVLVKSRNSIGGLNAVAEVQEDDTKEISPCISAVNVNSVSKVPENPDKPALPSIPAAGCTVNRRIPHLHKLEKKHSSGDLHSRLKTRKLLGVGETDDGDVHRSKLSQILGHSDQLYIRLPSGLRLWQIVLAVVFSVLSLWALLFPGHYFHAMYDMDGSSFTFPIRLYACALICISVMYWSTVHAADRDVIRMILLSSVVFFTLQSGVMVLGMLMLVMSVTKWTITLLGLQCVCVLIGYFFHCGMACSRTGALKRTTSNKNLCEKDQ